MILGGSLAMYVVYLSVVKDRFIDDRYNITILEGKREVINKNVDTKRKTFELLAENIPTTIPVNYKCFTSHEFDKHN